MLNTPKSTHLTAEIHKENLTPDEQSALYALLTKAAVPPKPSVWKPTYGENYWVVTGYGGVCRYTWTDIESDEAYYSMDNCFPTRESAEFAAERLKVHAELQQYADEHCAPIDWRSTQQKWFFMYSPESAVIAYAYTLRNRYAGTVYFTDLETAKNAAGTIGEDRIKKYLFGVEDEAEPDLA